MSVIGAVIGTDHMSVGEIVELAQRYETIGHRELWIPEFFGREQMVLASHLLANTDTVGVTTGISNVYVRDAMSAAQAAHTLNEMFDGRFTLGLGVSHPFGAEMRGHEWVPPVEKITSYITDIRAAREKLRGPKDESPILMAAHGPKMLAAAGAVADGANTYLMPPEHTADARSIVGPDTLLTVTLPCCLSIDPGAARAVARKALSMYLPLPAYQRAWTRWGLGDDMVGGGTDRLIDSAVAWGDAAAIRRRMGEHLDAGADQIAVIPYNPVPRAGVPWDLLEAVAN
ncbi:MAG: putative F420-dependent oxidoreductase [Candidatus Poriferisodalaceae bacterium]|jgi:probable F420-dependent oxidoreductase